VRDGAHDYWRAGQTGPNANSHGCEQQVGMENIVGSHPGSRAPAPR
jgi:hypothetical protein